MKKNSKRILSVTIRRMIDESPDTSYLGEYSNRPKTEYAIDRAHYEDCIINTHTETDETECANCGKPKGKHGSVEMSCPDSEEPETWSENYSFEPISCDCDERGDMGRNEFRYFNGPVENYKGLPDAKIRKYVRQDYERMESLNAGNWCYIGIRAEAKVVVVPFSNDHGVVVQRITSGGLFGVESDADRSYLDEIQKDELANLKAELLALGFSTRAIATAFKNVQEVDR